MQNAIILAAGKGTRMKSGHAKVMHQLLAKPMISHIYDNLTKAGITNVVMVVGHNKEEIEDYFGDKVVYAVQEPQLGSGHAVKCAGILKKEEGLTLIVNGDCPLIQKETYKAFLKAGLKNDLTVMTAEVEDPFGYGRIVRDENGDLKEIVEEKECDINQKKIKEINAGIYCVDNKLLWKYLPLINNDNKKGEYYFTDIIAIFREKGLKCGAYKIKDADEAMGINDRVALSKATRWLKNKVNNDLMNKGVTLIDPDNTYISVDTVIGMDSIVYPGVIMEGTNKIGKECVITSGSYLKNAVLKDNVYIDSSEITDSIVGQATTIGPDSHLRNNCKIGKHCRIGNFVELKNTSFGDNTKCAHLTYVGDSTVGSRVNFGCGVVTVNYDGKNKFHTVIDDEAFIGSNVNIIAPVHIGKKALLAAGSTINQDVKDGDMGIARERQSNIKGYGKKYLNK